MNAPTWGDRIPRINGRPGYEAFAASPCPHPGAPTGKAPIRFAPIRPVARFPDAGPDGGKLRVGLWSPVLFEAGAEAWMLALARSLADRVSWRGLAVAEGAGATAAGMADRFAPLMPVAYGRDACAALAAACDVVIMWAIPDVPALLSGLGRPPKVVNVCHSPLGSEWGVNSYRDPAGVDAYVAVSELALGPIQAASRGDARVIWNCVDEPRMAARRDRAAMRRAWGVPDGAAVLGSMGRLSPEKRPGATVEALACSSGRWHAVIVGAGPLRSHVEARARELGVSSRVHLVGADHAAGDVLAGFDVLLVPSEYESFGLTLAEGLWAGVPVVSTRVGLAKIRPGLTHEVPDGADGPALAIAAARALRDGPMPGSREWARANLSAARFARQWFAFLRGLAPPRAPDAARLALLAETCPSGSGPCGCGTGPPRECGHPDRPPLVRKADCLDCSARRWWASGVEAGW